MKLTRSQSPHLITDLMFFCRKRQTTFLRYACRNNIMTRYSYKYLYFSASPFVCGGLMRSYSDFKFGDLIMFCFFSCYNKNECGSSLNRIKSLSRYQPQENYITFLRKFATRIFSAERR